MGRRIVAMRAGHDGNIGLWLRLIIEGDWHLNPHRPPISEAGARRILDEPHGGRVKCSLWLTDDEVAAEQLDVLPGLEDSKIDEAVVLGALPTSQALVRCCHDRYASESSRARQCREVATPRDRLR